MSSHHHQPNEHEAPQKPVPPHHLLILGSTFLLATAVALIAPRWNQEPEDPWAVVEEIEGPLRVAIGIPRGETPPTKIILPMQSSSRPAVLRRYSLDKPGTPDLSFGSVPKTASLSLGGMKSCLGGASLIAILSLPSTHSTIDKARAYRIHALDSSDKPVTPHRGLCVVVAFRQWPLTPPGPD